MPTRASNFSLSGGGPSMIMQGSASVSCAPDGSVTITAASAPGGLSRSVNLFTAPTNLSSPATGDLQWQRTTDGSEVVSTGEIAGIFVVRYSTAVSSSGRLVGADFTAAVPTGSVGNYTGSLGVIGVIAGAAHGGTGTVGNMTGVFVDLWPSGPGLTTNVVRFFAGSEWKFGVGLVTNHYGLYITSMGAATNNYGIYIQSVTGATSYAYWAAAGRLRNDGQVGLYGDTDVTALVNLGKLGAFAGSSGVLNGLLMTVTATSAVTADLIGINLTTTTAAAVYTTGVLIGMLVNTPGQGSGSIITGAYGIYVGAQSVGTAGYGIYVASGSVTYAIWVAGGTTRLDGPLSISGKISHSGQTGNTIAGNVANQPIGVSGQVAVLASGAATTVVIANTLATAASLIQVTPKAGTTTPATTTSLSVSVLSIIAGISFTVSVRNTGTTATLVTDYILQYTIHN